MKANKILYKILRDAQNFRFSRHAGLQTLAKIFDDGRTRFFRDFVLCLLQKYG